MTCDKCANEKFHTLKVFRNRQREDGVWKYNPKCDTRFIACSECGQRYTTETFLKANIVFKNYKRLEQIPGTQEEFPF